MKLPFSFTDKSALYVILGAIVLYSISLTFGFFWDDSVIIQNNEVIRDIQYIPDFFSLQYWQYFDPGSPGHYRPVRLLGYSILYSLFGAEPSVYHAWNIFLYCMVLMALLRCGKALGLNRQSLLAGTLLFVVHPLHVEVVAWAKNSSELLATLFILLSWIYFMKYLDIDGATGETEKRIFLIVSVLLFTFSLMSKETGVVYPVLLALYLLLFRGSTSMGEKARSLFPFVIVSLCFVLFITLFLHPGIPGNPLMKQIDLQKSLFLVPITIVIYLKLLCFPFPLNIDRGLDGPFFMDPVTFIIPLFLIISLIVLHIFLIKRNGKLSFFFFWIIISLIPVSNIFYIYGRPLAEQRVFWGSIGFCLYLGEMYRLSLVFLEKRKAGQAARLTLRLSGCALILVFSAISFQRLLVWSDTEALWKDTIRRSPNSARVVNNLGALYLERGELDKAEVKFRRAMEMDQDYALAYFNLGTVNKRKGDMESALSNFRECLERDPAFAASSMEVGLVHLGNDQLDQAMQFFKSALYYDHMNPYIHYHIGVVHHRMKNYEEAEKMYASAIDLSPAFPEVYNDFAILLERKGDPGGALHLYKLALEKHPAYTMGRLNLGIYYLKRKYYKFALSEFQKCMEEKPHLAIGYLNYCKTLIALKQYDDALATLDKLLAFDSDNQTAQLLKGKIFFEQGHIDQATTTFQLISETYPENGPAKLWLAKALVNQGSHVRAEKITDQLVRENQPHPALYYELGKLYMGMGKNKKGEALFFQSLNMAPENLDTRISLGNYYLEQGKSDEALQLCEQELTREEPDASIVVLAAKIYYERELLEKALETLSSTSESIENRGEIYSLEGNILSSLGKYENAVKAYMNAARLEYETDRNVLRAARIIAKYDISLQKFPFLNEIMNSREMNYKKELAAYILSRNYQENVIKKFESYKLSRQKEDQLLIDYYLGIYLQSCGKAELAKKYFTIVAATQDAVLPEVSWARITLKQKNSAP